MHDMGRDIAKGGAEMKSLLPAADTPLSSRIESTVRSRLSAYLPLLAFLGLVVIFGIGLTLDPRKIPSPLIGKPVPVFDLPPVKGRELGLSSADLKGEVSLVNVFASWCTACREEHPLLMELKEQG